MEEGSGFRSDRKGPEVPFVRILGATSKRHQSAAGRRERRRIRAIDGARLLSGRAREIDHEPSLGRPEDSRALHDHVLFAARRPVALRRAALAQPRHPRTPAQSAGLVGSDSRGPGQGGRRHQPGRCPGSASARLQRAGRQHGAGRPGRRLFGRCAPPHCRLYRASGGPQVQGHRRPGLSDVPGGRGRDRPGRAGGRFCAALRADFQKAGREGRAPLHHQWPHGHEPLHDQQLVVDCRRRRVCRDRLPPLDGDRAGARTPR